MQGYLEGNVVEAPDGTLYDILRFNSEPNVLGNWAIALKINIANSSATAGSHPTTEGRLYGVYHRVG